MPFISAFSEPKSPRPRRTAEKLARAKMSNLRGLEMLAPLADNDSFDRKAFPQ